MTWTTWTADSFVKALRQSNDVQLAIDAYNDHSFYLPAKPQLLADWALNRLLKHSACIEDVKMWSLLREILLGDSLTAPTWLPALLYKIPVVPILTSISRLLVESPQQELLLEHALPVLRSVLPLAYPKTRLDTILECLWACIDALSSTHLDVLVSDLAFLGFDGFLLAFQTASNKGKIYVTFVKEHLPSWIVSVRRTKSANLVKLHNALWTVGTDILSSHEALRTTLEPPSDAESLFYNLGTSLHEKVDETASVLPRLFATQSEVLQKQKNTLAQANITITPVQYFTSLRLLYDSADEAPSVWKARAETIEIVESMKLVSTAGASWNEEIRNTVLACCRTLDKPSMDGQFEHHPSVFRCLAILSALNYNIVGPQLSNILQACATSHPLSSSSCQDLIRVIIEYHSKTRTLPDYLNAIYQVLAHLTSNDGPPSLYAFCGIMNGPLLARSHGSHLIQSLSTFLTPGQTPKVAETVSRALDDLFRSVQDLPRGPLEKNKKKRRSSAIPSVSPWPLIRLAFLFRLASYVLPGLPASSLPPTAFENLRTTIRSLTVDTIIPAAMFSINCSRDGHDDAWVWSAIGAAALHLYSAVVTRCRWVGGLPTLAEQEKQEMVEVLHKQGSGDLGIEAARVLFRHGDRSMVEAVLRALESQDGDTSIWNGRGVGLSSSESKVALWALSSTHWVTFIDRHSNTSQMQRFVRLLLRCVDSYQAKDPSAENEVSSGIMVGQVVWGLVRSAIFWELSNLRDASLAYMSEQTASLESISPKYIANCINSNISANLTIENLSTDVFDIFNFLLLCPLEWIGRAKAKEFAKRAILADVALWYSAEFSRLPDDCPEKLRRSAKLKACSARLAPEGGSGILYTGDALLLYLLQFRGVPEEGGQSTILQAHMDLLNIVYSLCIRATIEGTSTALESVLASDSILVSPESPESLRSLSSLFSLLATQFKVDQIPGVVKGLIKMRASQVEAFLETELMQGRNAISLTLVLSICRAYLEVKYWLGDGDISTNLIPLAVKRVALKGPTGQRALDDMDERVELLWILAENVRHAGLMQQTNAIDLLLAVYFSITSGFDLSIPASFDKPLAKATKSLSVKEYQRALSTLCEDLRVAPDERKGIAIHASTVMLHNTPEGTFKVSHEHISEMLASFNSMELSSRSSPTLSTHVLTFVVAQCQEKPAHLQQNAVVSIWVLLAKFLQPVPADEHTEHTCPSLYLQITNIASALVRNRRDLVAANLPHLALILCRLVSALKSPRPNLGRKQGDIVAGSLPGWVISAEPLGEVEAKALARLITALSTKTTLRSRFSGSTPSSGGRSLEAEAKSLAKAFSKHAPSVLLAYIRSVNDPLCLVSRGVRDELASGCYALCGMMGEKGRDSITPVLDNGGKMILTTLWAAYQKERYVGQG